MKILLTTLILTSTLTFEQKVKKRVEQNRIEFNKKYQSEIENLISPDKYYKLLSNEKSNKN